MRFTLLHKERTILLAITAIPVNFPSIYDMTTRPVCLTLTFRITDPYIQINGYSYAGKPLGHIVGGYCHTYPSTFLLLDH